MQAKYNDRRSMLQKVCYWAHTNANELCLTIVLAGLMLCEPVTDLVLWLVYLN